MKLFNVIRGSVATMFIGATVFAQQPNQPVQSQPNQVQPGQTQTEAGQQPTGQQPTGQQPTGQQPTGQKQTGQKQAGRQQAGRQQAGRQQAGQPKSDQHSPEQMQLSNDVIAACLAIENQDEIRIAQFANDKSNDKEVKEFASMLVEEHTGMLDALRKVAPNSIQRGTLKDSDHSDPSTEQSRNRDQSQDQNSNSNQGQNQATPTSRASNKIGAAGSTLDIVQLHRELSEQCLTDAKEKLTQKSDGDFDKCFVAMQVAKHAGMQSKLTVLQRHATGELKNTVSQGLETTKKHLKHAEKLLEQLDKNEPIKTTKIE